MILYVKMFMKQALAGVKIPS